MVSPLPSIRISGTLPSDKEAKEKYELVLPLLKSDEKKVLVALKEAGGEMLQNKLVLKLNLSKVKVTRLLSSLQTKNLIIKERNGLTNNIKLIK